MGSANLPPALHLPHAVTVGAVQITAAKLAMILGSIQRWRILIALGHTEWLPAQYLAGVAGVSRTGASQHLRVLRENKIIEQGMGRLYRLSAPWRSGLAEGWIDFHLARLCIRFPTPPAAPASLPAPAPPALT